MPRDSQLKQDARLQPSARTAVDLKPERLDVVAKATDPFVQQGKDADLTGAVDVLKMVSGGLDSYSTLQKAQKEDNKLAGMTAAFTGEEPNKPSSFFNLGLGYTEGYEEMKGKIDASTTYNNAVNEYTATNSHLPPPEFQAGLKEITKKYLQQPGLTPHTVAGMIPEVMATDKSVINHNQKVWSTNVAIEHDSTFFANAQADLKGALQTQLGLNAIEQLKLDDVRDMLRTPEGIQKWSGVSSTLTSMYYDARAKAKEMGYSPTRVSEMYLDVVSKIATEYGRPELLEFTKNQKIRSQEEIDKGVPEDKRTLQSTYPEKVEKAIREATVMQHHLETEQKQRLKEQGEKEAHLVTSEAGQKLHDLLVSDDPDRIQKALAVDFQFRQKVLELAKKGTYISFDQQKYMDAQTDAIKNRGSFAPHNDDENVNKLYAKWNSLKVEDVIANKTSMTEVTYVSMLKHANDLDQAAKNRSVDKSHHYEYMAFDQVLKGLREPYMKYDKGTQTLTPESVQDLSKFDQMVGLKIRQGLRDPLELQQWYQKHVQPVLPIRDTMIGSPGDNKPPQQKAYDTPPPATGHKGRSMIDEKTWRKITSNGNNWIDSKTGKVVY